MDLVFKIAIGIVLGYFLIQKINGWLTWRKFNQISSGLIEKFKTQSEKMVEERAAELQLNNDQIKSLKELVEKAYLVQIGQLFNGAYLSEQSIEELMQSQENFIGFLSKKIDEKVA